MSKEPCPLIVSEPLMGDDLYARQQKRVRRESEEKRPGGIDTAGQSRHIVPCTAKLHSPTVLSDRFGSVAVEQANFISR